MPLMEIADATLHYDEYGTGDEVVLSSAMAFDPQAYPGCLAAPPTGHHVYTIQARGHGASSHPDSPPEQGWLDQWADDVCAFADRLGVDRFIYTGISHGGGIGWHLAGLILAAMRDGVISPESALRAARSVPGAKAVLFEDEGHFIGTESPERLVREVRVFVDELNDVAEPPAIARTGAGA
ncbi:alpha/beta fold hydrolase [Actinoallomurus iriomotensis]|uniref:AB hydrolase-1 domain-containing protein n=1 Tax=Actinoallomurus iriomotensis TaxID=478107 RepID=A0A9W6S8C7_9ACTN|nr:alpha/beta hydrolase [Actinoallomurus iriomotensis]GLY87460.1 hypothetical protein Airi02_053890 [Actinoallomurus iriomotensis]